MLPQSVKRPLFRCLPLAMVWAGVMIYSKKDKRNRSLIDGCSNRFNHSGRWSVNDAAKMYDLQKVDLTWARVRQRLLEIQRLLGESEELLQLRSRVAQTETDLHDWRGKQQDAELESRSLAERIESAEKQLMSGAIHNPKELEALQASVDSMRRHRTQVDDHAVEAMVAADGLAGQLEELQQSLTRLEGTWSSGQTGLREEETKMKQNYVILKRKREALAAEMQPALLDRYEQMRKRRGGVAVAPVHNGVCGACHVDLPTGVISALQSNRDELVMCTSCGRYLFLA